MFLPYSKCKCCGRIIGFLEWWRILRFINITAKKEIPKIIEEYPNLSIQEVNKLAIKRAEKLAEEQKSYHLKS